MGNKLFGVDIAKIVNQSIGKDLLDGTLTKYTAGSLNPNDYTAPPTTTSASYAFKGIVEDYKDFEIDGTSIQASDRKVLLIGDSIASLKVPAVGDKVTIEGSAFFVVGTPKRDPAAATYTCQVR